MVRDRGESYLLGIKAMRRSLFIVCDVYVVRFTVHTSLSKGQKPYAIQFDSSENSQTITTVVVCVWRVSNGLKTNIVENRQYIYFYFVFFRTRRQQWSQVTNFVEMFLNEYQKKTRIYTKSLVNYVFRKHKHRWLFVVLLLKLRSLFAIPRRNTFSSDRALNVPVNPCTLSVFLQRNAKNELHSQLYVYELWLGADYGTKQIKRIKVGWRI